MEFKPAYYADKLRVIENPEADFEKEKLNVINPYGTAGIVTLWSKPWDVWKNLQARSPELFSKDSPVVTLTSLYGNGLPQMLANLANNPQIEYLAVTGNDTKVVPSFTYLQSFLQKGVEYPVEKGQFGKIKDTEFPIDPQLDPNLFKHLKVQRFQPQDLESIVSFVSQPATRIAKEEDRTKITLIEPEFSDFPSDIFSHSISAETPLKAWMDVLYHIDRFGENVQLEKGRRRALYNLKVTVSNPAPEDPALLKEFGFSIDKLMAYRNQMLEGNLPEGTTYTYGNRFRKYFGVDALENVVKRLKEDPLDRRAFLTTWDNKNDIISAEGGDSSVPCLTSAYFVNHKNKLNMMAEFRTHSAVSAWLLNFYGLRKLQEYVSENTGIQPGKLQVTSRWIGIDPDDGKTNSALEIVKKNRRVPLNVDDPRGYFVIDPQEDYITATHYSPNSQKLREYRGKTAIDVKNQLRQDSVISDPDHATWIGIKLAMAHYKLHGKMPEE